MRAGAVLIGLLLLIPAGAALLPTVEAQNPFTTSLLLSAAPPGKPLPASGNALTTPVTVQVACTAMRGGPVTLAVVDAPAWLTATLADDRLQVPSDPRECNRDGYFHLRDTLTLKAGPSAHGDARGEVRLQAKRDGDTASATVPVRVEALAKLAVPPPPPSFSLDPATREAMPTLSITNEGNLILEVRVEPSAPPSVLVDPPKLLKVLDPGVTWSTPVLVRASADRDEPFTLRLSIRAVAQGASGATTSETLVWYFVPPAGETPAPASPGIVPVEVHSDPELEDTPAEEPPKETPAPGLALALGALAVAGIAARRRA